MFTVYWEMIFQRIWFRLTKVFWAGCLTLCSVCNFSQCRLQSYPCFYSLALIIGLTRRRRRVRFKEYILVIEQRAPSCVFQTIAHPTSPRLSQDMEVWVCCFADLIQILVNLSKNDSISILKLLTLHPQLIKSCFPK